MVDRPVFEPVPAELDFRTYELRILELWKKRRVFERSLEQHGTEAPHFVFYEGPPTANGVPHNGHVLTRVVKDLFPRYQAMCGKRVLRKGGWDTHGLPVEVEVERELRIHGKAAIEEYGVRPFAARCIESVFRYTAEWERLTERIGFWVSLDDAYVTYHKSYVESVWWALSELFSKGLLYQGHKVVWWWAQGGTALSAAEVGLGYKTIDDPSVYVVLPLVDEPETGLLVWTTTPWTLPSNGYAAVRGNTNYDVVRVGEAGADKAGGADRSGKGGQGDEGGSGSKGGEGEKGGNGSKGAEARKGAKGDKSGKGGKGGKGKKPPVELNIEVKQLIVASELRPALQEKLGRPLRVVRTLRGEELVGTRYRPPFDAYYDKLADARVQLKDGGDDALWWRVIAEDFVTLDTGTGIVHIAPAFGEDDSQAHRRQLGRYARPDEVELLCGIKPDGTFTSEWGRYAGRWVKDCDPELTRELQDKRILLLEEMYRHDYPFCWRADEDPLLQMARPAWFIRTTGRLQSALENNQAVNWLPEHIKDGRFGDFLENNVDWALSRERYWGTPLNVWVCEKCEHQQAPSSVAEIEKLNPRAFDHWYSAKREDPKLNDHLIVHKPWIDEVTLPCEKCGGTMRRVPDVIDCWFDSGCMPFAQWGFPHEPGAKERFDDAFPADFISEAIDQTRGWFYSLLMISSLVFDQETQSRLGLSRHRDFPHPFKTCIVLGHVSDREGKKESKSKGNYTPPEIILDRVRMEFGVLSEAFGTQAKSGEALIAREDLDGMDLVEGAKVAVYRADRPDQKHELSLRAHQKLPRRVVLLPEDVVGSLELQQVSTGLETPPVEVPRVPASQRVMLEDESTPAPGADAFRWFFYANSPPWTNTRHSLRNVRTLQKDFQVKLRNVYSFFTIYANIDGWSPLSPGARPVAERALLDRYILSELHLAIREVRRAMDRFLIYDAAVNLVELVEALSNWYVRRSRARFWGPGLPPDKCDAYTTLYEALVTIAKLAAPFIPFFSEEMYQNLVVCPGAGDAPDSVHLSSFPAADPLLIDERLSEEVAAVRDIVSLGLSVRTANKLKVRQPLSRADVVLNDGALMKRIEAYQGPIQDELNVHELVLMHPGHEQGAVSFRLKPNFRALGPRLGKNVQAVKQALSEADGGALHAQLSTEGKITLEISGEAMQFGPDEIAVTVEAAAGFAAETGRVGVVVLHTTLTDELVDEGILRELLSRIQATRKELRLDFADRIQLWLDGSERVLRVARAGEEHLKRECLATGIHLGQAPADAKEQKLGEEVLRLLVRKGEVAGG